MPKGITFDSTNRNKMKTKFLRQMTSTAYPSREQMISKLANFSKVGSVDYLVRNDRITALNKLSDLEIEERYRNTFPAIKLNYLKS